MKIWLRQNLWRHLIGISICLFSLFPLYLVVISSFNSSGSLQLTSFIPTEISFSNYKMLFNDPTIPYLTWVKNSLIIAGTVAGSVARGLGRAMGHALSGVNPLNTTADTEEDDDEPMRAYPTPSPRPSPNYGSSSGGSSSSSGLNQRPRPVDVTPWNGPPIDVSDDEQPAPAAPAAAAAAAAPARRPRNAISQRAIRLAEETYDPTLGRRRGR
jgi:hypothetical protein